MHIYMRVIVREGKDIHTYIHIYTHTQYTHTDTHTHTKHTQIHIHIHIRRTGDEGAMFKKLLVID